VRPARLLRWFAATLLLGPSPSHLNAQDVDQQVRREVATYLQRLSGGSPEAVADLYARTMVPTSLGDGRAAEGRGPITGLYRQFFRAAGRARVEADSVHVTPLGPGSALAWFRFHWVEGGEGGGVLSLVYVREGSRWAILHDHMSLTPAPGGGSTQPRSTYDGPPQPAQSSGSCLVSKIVDGDTIECEPLGRIRLIGIDAPERDQAPHGATSAEELGQWIPEGSRVTLEPDVNRRDRYGRLLAYLWYGGEMVNWWMVREGWALAYRYEPDVRWADVLARAETSARGERRGLWAVGGFTCAPSDHRRRRC
jgi:endonuclease YncB( thermonuclease family)